MIGQSRVLSLASVQAAEVADLLLRLGRVAGLETLVVAKRNQEEVVLERRLAAAAQHMAKRTQHQAVAKQPLALQRQVA